MEAELARRSDEEPSRRGPLRRPVLINAFARTLGRAIGAAVVTARQTGLSSWMQSVALHCFKQIQETASCFPMAAQDPARARTLPNPDSPRGPALVSRRA